MTAATDADSCQTECDGQTGYTAHILDRIVEKVVRQLFERMKAIPKSEIVNVRYHEKMEERKALLVLFEPTTRKPPLSLIC